MAERTEEEMPAAGGIIRGSSNRLRGSSKVLAQSLSNARTTARWRISSTHRLRTVITGGTTGARTRMDTLASILTTNTRTLLTRCTTRGAGTGRRRCTATPALATAPGTTWLRRMLQLPPTQATWARRTNSTRLHHTW